MNKAILFATLFAISYATMTQTSMPGSWNSFKFNDSFQSDSSSPLTKIFDKLSTQLKQQGITNIKFTSAQSQVVNGMNFKVQFTYIQEGISQNGDCIAYVSFSGETCEINEVELQKESQEILAASVDNTVGGWVNYKFDLKQLSNPSSPFTFAYNNLIQSLEKQGIKLMNITKVESQVVSGQKFKISFVYRENNALKIGQAVIYVQTWTKTVEMTELELQGQSIEF